MCPSHCPPSSFHEMLCEHRVVGPGMGEKHILYYVCFNLYCGGFILFCNMWVCVCVCVGFVMCVFVRVL